MAGTSIIPSNSADSQKNHKKIRGKTTVDTKTTITGLIIPKGTRGTVIGYHFNGKPINDLVIDFGLLSVVILNPDSHLIEIIEQEGEE